MVMKGVLQASTQQISNCNLAGVIGIDSVFTSLGMHLRQFICLVTQRYEMSLKDYLRRYKLDMNTCMVVLAQIFEVVAYLEDQSVVHRAISSENFFVESTNNNSYPHLLLGHFDNAHSTGNKNGLLIPFQHETLDPRLSDLACQAPEVSRAKPGKRALIDYRKADAWSAGILAYEVLTGSNQFKEHKIDSRTFMEKEIPSLHLIPMPHVLKMIARLLLSVNPSKRLSANEAADMLHFEIFAESPLVSVTNQIPELCSWLTAHSAEMLARQQQDQVLVDLCRCFFRRIEPTNLFRSYKLWLLIKG
uniref:non-specific serine/threonine protein kinase n=1 Tax=Ciona savignyi TaxID=51511 RepID=H2YCR6_CIOSA